MTSFDQYMMDPSGGNPVHQTRMYDWGILGMDVGLTMFGRGIGRKLMKGETRRIRSSFRGDVLDPRIAERAAERYPGAIKRARRATHGFGKSLARLGWMTAALSVFDMGLEFSTWMSEPSVTRAAIDEDRKLFTNESMLDTRAAWTSRQRALQAVHDSQLSLGRSMIGREAEWLHK